MASRLEFFRKLESYVLNSVCEMQYLENELKVSHTTIRRSFKDLRALGSDVQFNGTGWFATKAAFKHKKPAPAPEPEQHEGNDSDC